ncbi:hypothetical protein M1B72_15160 [Geomonas paludis]|uniref:Uncharacterized protein n=1 Tax=Geomonas paludis TaxID=2740185 RepID=A0ABY4LD49_9BACT|nr:hypothetical protein [Geomonas paludis]UPU34780.1 hypothetical protein M1B72_15160 [Geomonas paludis]
MSQELGTKLQSYFDRVIVKPIWGKFRQGTIFNCVPVERTGEVSNAYGIVITAHCDLANEKVSCVTFLQVVTIEDWCSNELSKILCKNLTNDVDNKIKKCIEDSGIDSSILKYESLNNIIEKHYNPKLPDRKTEQTIEKISAEQDKMTRINEISNMASIDKLVVAELRTMNQKMFDKYIGDCMARKLSEYYYLPAIWAGKDEGNGYVVLMRQIQSLPFALADAVAGGLEYPKYKAMSAENESYRGKLMFQTEDDFAMPIGQLSSPNLEHLMQSFSNLYTRIGLENLPNGLVDKVCDTYTGE